MHEKIKKQKSFGIYGKITNEINEKKNSFFNEIKSIKKLILDSNNNYKDAEESLEYKNIELKKLEISIEGKLKKKKKNKI